MTERDRIKERLKKKEIEIQVLEEKLRSARIYAQALHDVIKMMEEEDHPHQAADSVLRPGSAVAQAREVILRRGEPVHINDLLAALGREMTRESRASLTSSIAAYVRRQDIFTRPAPNTFGLIELGHTNIADDSPQPPKGFGGSPEEVS
jgi:1,2-phenylacetyl-CoA epoxidase PaaB subunit